MWRFLFAFSMAAAVVLSTPASGQESQRPYGPFDAIAEGTERSESQRLALIDSQLETVGQLAQVTRRRALLRESGVAAVYPYGRRGILGFRPRGYVVVRRPPAVARRSYAVQPSYDLGYERFDYPIREAVRQPIGHELMRTGPNRWQYRPLYAEDDRQLDETHREIERSLRPLADGYSAERAGYASDGPRRERALRANEPEELPEPQDLENGGRLTENDRLSPRHGEARDIGRDRALNQTSRPTVRQPTDERRDDRAPPPPPQPDPPDQPRNSTGIAAPSTKRADAVPDADKKQPTNDKELRGPLLQDPSTGAREF